MLMHAGALRKEFVNCRAQRGNEPDAKLLFRNASLSPGVLSAAGDQTDRVNRRPSGSGAIRTPTACAQERNRFQGLYRLQAPFRAPKTHEVNRAR
jgi:hypothetical protein